MLTDVLMPQMGESVTEGTVTKWLKKEGDTVGRDEPLFEISTEKVDAEIPSPAAGTLAKILVSEGQTVGVRTVVGQIESQEQPAGIPKQAPKEAAQATAKEPAKQAAPPIAAPAGPRPGPVAAVSGAKAAAAEEEVRSSPLVRRLAAEHRVDLSQVEGTGMGGRITKEDLLAFVERRKGEAGEAAPAGEPSALEEVVAMTPMRRKIAEHMVLSRRTSAHVTTVFAVDFSRIVDITNREKERFEREANIRLSYTPFFIRAVIDGLKRFPILNSSLSGDTIIYKKYINMGIAVALEWGLIVPVIRNADEKSFLGLTRALSDLADRARAKKLSVEEVQAGTFTITNPGALGALFATPIINQPQVAILGVGAVNKMPVVINDAIAIRSIVHLSLSYDHRVIDGAVADQFMAAVKKYLENWEEDLL
jgi:pyruvate dehydrogenase E2 component (dihydrolipoamide acetyltransferase)